MFYGDKDRYDNGDVRSSTLNLRMATFCHKFDDAYLRNVLIEVKQTSSEASFPEIKTTCPLLIDMPVSQEDCSGYLSHLTHVMLLHIYTIYS